MVKKKGKSKRTSLKDKYKIERRVVQKHRKDRKEAKKNPGKFNNKSKKDPGIPNSWPFKEEMLKEVERAKEKEKQRREEMVERNREFNLKKKGLAGGSMEAFANAAQSANQDFDSSQTTTSSSNPNPNDPLASKTTRQTYMTTLQHTISQSSIVLHVLDARDPLSFLSSYVVNQTLKDPTKKLILVLNKSDLVPKSVLQSWLTYLRRRHPTIPLSCKRGPPTSLLELLKNYSRTKDSGKLSQVVGLVGYPNVGKSSIINSLAHKSKPCGTSPIAGFTKACQEVVLDKKLTLIDSPGVILDSVSNSVLLRNCVSGSEISDPITVVSHLISKCSPENLMSVYGIPDFRVSKNPTETFCSLVGRLKGKVGKGGVPDKIESARGIIKDWNEGVIKFYAEPPEEDLGGEVKIVDVAGEEFDWKKMDEGGGGEMDVEDCVGMRGGEMGGGLEEFEEEEEDMEEEEEEEEEEESMEVEKVQKAGKKFSRKELEEAEDFF
ncbi:hypothetical protein TrST_g9027 [Triparma strigata]|uniref:CP-type G domain-containing protein n=1 Tax=Triparma strigata TaxID=1606541 RepID=A0A9W6ZQX6_9STRA|nr:hypothetical protein TrST_g9027 [Triparma strigata]